ncbi:MAG: S41 family peptidase [Bacillales bacterium]|nr:S41 family peptidase [Bacillales bacterium]
MNNEDIYVKRMNDRIKTMKRKSVISILCCTVSSLVVGLGVGFITGNKLEQSKQSPEMVEFLKFYDYFKNNYYQDVDERTLIDGLYYGVTNSVDDDFTFYTSTANNEKQDLSTSGYGFGFSRVVYYGDVLLGQVMRNSPAAEAVIKTLDGKDTGLFGLKPGDIITKVREVGEEDYYVFKEHNYSNWSSAFVGEKDTQLEFYFTRGDKQYTSTITRGRYNQDKVTLVDYDIDSNYKYAIFDVNSFLGLTSSGETTPQAELNSYLEKTIFNRTDHLNELTIDLRDNGGGYVDNFRGLVGLFTDNVTAGYYLYQDGTYYALNTFDDGGVNYSSKIDHYTLIVNEGTASAAESFVLAMQDIFKDKVDVFGETSYGKGIAQNFYQVMDDGSMVRFTFAKVCSPDKRCINKVGIVPKEENCASYRSIQDDEIYYLWRNHIESVNNNDQLSEKEKAAIKTRIELLTSKEFKTFDDALLFFQEGYKLEKTGVFNEKTANKLNDLFFDYYHTYKPTNIYTSFVMGNNEEYDIYSPTQMNCVKKQINLLLGTSFYSFSQAVLAFQDANGLSDKMGLYDYETSYLLQGKMYDERLIKEASVLEEVKTRYGK